MNDGPYRTPATDRARRSFAWPAWSVKLVHSTFWYAAGVSCVLSTLYAWRVGAWFWRTTFDFQRPESAGDGSWYIFMWAWGVGMLASPLWATWLGKHVASTVRSVWPTSGTLHKER